MNAFAPAARIPWPWVPAAAALVGGLLCVFGWSLSAERFFQSYLFAFVFWLEPALGCLGFLMLHHLVGGGWGRAVRRFLEAGSLTLPLMALLFLPVAWGLVELYPWAREEAHGLLLHKRPYLNPTGYYARAAVYFLIWGLLAALLAWFSSAEARHRADPDRAEGARRGLRALSGPGLILFAFAVNFAAVDWTMSLEPEWFSTLYGFLFLTHLAPATLALLLLCGVLAAGPAFAASTLDISRFRDLGTLLLAFLILWMYASFFQYMLIWFGNLPEEIGWYLRRNAGGWSWLARFFVLFHFALPFGILLFRANRSRPRTLAWLGGGLLAVHAAYVYWFVAPSFHPEGIRLHWLDFAAWFGVGGLWLLAFRLALQGRPAPAAEAAAMEATHG